ncbi:Mannosylfructose-phosphate synthase [Fundidesulfovibrio magnetotacticus]|uniref:Mannosylfructose-phosphate synthase n=1 Tax=Fundidesulfovibrio magnetotacticus TaxID=2730080 RepID=A0A6V8LX87_9BACT|nr:glycosyltransferase [Fundidesulfovibrio magnetotacticus]GFK95201.1 Mannosylfructose-phosphate synthase [Fundidesulfovibrio magnetotacticus]
MRVLHLGKFYPPVEGGIETVTFQLAEGLTRRGVQSDVLCFDPKGPGGVELWNGYTVRRACAPIVAASTPMSQDYAKLLSRLAPDYDILHVHCPNPMAALALRWVRPRARVVLQWHSDVVRQRALNVVYRALLGNWLARRADAVIGATPAHLEASEYAQAFRGKSVVIPFGLDPAPFAPELTDRAALERLERRFAGRKAVFALGRLASYKGFDVLVEAMAHLPPEWVALMGGSGPMEEALRARIRERGLEDRAVLLGRVPQGELSAHYRFSRVFCLPSTTRAEMFGMVQLEAMACGCPVVSTRIAGSGVPWVNEHGATGLTVAPGDPAALAGAILRAGEEPLRSRLSGGAALAATERFAPRLMETAVLALYRELAGG